MSNTFSLESIKEGIEKHLRNEIEFLISSNIDKLKEDIEMQIRDKIGSVATKVLHNFEFRGNENQLCIFVNTKDMKF